MRAAAVLALALGALLAGGSSAAVAADEREEYTPRSRPLPDGEVCHELDVTRTILWQIAGPNGRVLPHPVATTCTFSDLREWVGTGPRRRATIGTLERSGRFGGTSVGLEAVEAPGPATYRENAISCPPPPGALPGQFGRDAKQGVGEFTSVFGPDLADLFTPNLARQFGRPRMSATQTVKRRRPSGPDGSLASEATFTLELTRCPDKGRDARPC